MEKVKPEEFGYYIEYAERCTANRVYPLSVAAGIQKGEIFTDGFGVLFWHYCGFAYIAGEVREGFLEDIYRHFLMNGTGRKFLLITDSEAVTDHYASYDTLQFSRRIEYIHSGRIQCPAVQDEGFIIERITADNIACIRGRIIPSFSWDSSRAFLEKGYGFLARKGDSFAAAAFSAAVSPDEVDIGAETFEDCRHKGLAAYLSSRMCEEIIRQGRKPVWAHAETNEGSRRTAVRAGFTADRINTVIRRKA